MTHRLLPRRRVIAATSTMLPFTGCSVLPSPPNPQIYRLNPVLGAFPPGRTARGPLAIATPAAPLSLDTSRIALTRGATRFDYYAESVWTDRLPALLQSLLVRTFEDSGRIAEVAADSGTVLRGAVLHVGIERFQAQYPDLDSHDAEVIVALDLHLNRMPDGNQIGWTRIDQRARPERNQMDSIVAAFDAATAAALRRTVEWTLPLLPR